MARLNAEQWSEISPHLDKALDLDGVEREQYLSDLDSENGAVALLVRECLAAQQQNDDAGFLEESPLKHKKEVVAGQQVGPYSLEAPLGRGGMGSVWRARRSDGRFDATVAIKILDMRGLGSTGEEQIRREASLLARLSHPNIARVFDAGILEDGQPYLILEYVEGERIDQYCESNSPLLVSRLRLYLQLLSAVTEAHAQQIVHRDIKPTNILVTVAGVVKLLDFGVASLQAPATPADEAISHGSVGGLTAGYAAPEQIRGEPVTPASDVYALGVLLHVLITGQHPFGSTTSTHTQLARAALAQDAHPASESVDSKESRRWVRGDLDAIVAKSMEREAALRYPTAAELAADITRFLGGIPVLARPQTWLQRGRLLVRRGLGGTPDGSGPRWLPIALALILIAGATAVALKQIKGERGSDARATSTAFAPPPHSIAVLPFVNLSGDKEQEYLSDGLTEELLNSLAGIDGLQVAARTSSFSFKEHPDLAIVAHKLHVGAILEGSVRRSENTIRITAQLINAVTGFQLWSKTYDRGLGDVLKLQTEIATEVAGALKVSLLGDASTRIELGGTRSPAAFDAYLRGAKALYSSHDPQKDLQTAIAAYTEAIRLDPSFALAFVGRSHALSTAASAAASDLREIRDTLDRAQADAQQAIKLAPDLAEAHLALAEYLESGPLDFIRASAAYQHALMLAPGNAAVLRGSGSYAILMGHFDVGLPALRRAVVLDPLNPLSHFLLGQGLLFGRRYGDAIATLAEALTLDPDYSEAFAYRGLAYYMRGDLESARSSCEKWRDRWPSQWCLAVTYDKLGRHADAEAVLAKMKASLGDTAAYQYTAIYAQWGNRTRALEWLETGLRLRDSGLEDLKVDPLMDPLRQEPRFQKVMSELKFPD